MNAEQYYKYEKLGGPEHFDEGSDNKEECCKSMNCRECIALADGFGYICPASIVNMYLMPSSIKLFDRRWNAAKRAFDRLDEKHKQRHIENQLDDFYRGLGYRPKPKEPLKQINAASRTKPVQLEIPF